MKAVNLLAFVAALAFGQSQVMLYNPGLSAPSAPTVTTYGVTGSTTYGYEVSFVMPTGPAPASPQTLITNGNATLNATNYNIVTAPACSVPNEQAAIYLSTPGGIDTNGGLLAIVPCGTAYQHQGNDGLGDSPPTTDLSVGLYTPSVSATQLLVANSPPQYPYLQFPPQPQPLFADLAVRSGYSLTVPGDSSGTLIGLLQQLVNTSAASDNSGLAVFGGNFTVSQDGGMNAGEVAGLYGIANAQNAASVGDLVGTEGDAQVLGADSSAYSATGVNAKVQLFSGGAVDNAYALRANIDAGVGGGSVTNGYGIWVYDMTAAANNWAIKTGAGTVEFGDLTSAPVFQGNSAAPSISGCGAMIAAASNNSAGMITAGTAAPCTITLTFTQPYAHGTFCNAVDQTTPAVFTQTAQSASSVTLKAASSTASDTIVYGCTPGY